ncbi:MAG: glycosyltransferase, partial [Candidatus Eiseniibacteriota bacterium]
DMKKVLFITYHFPPVGGGGVQRPTKFIKHLPTFGWIPHVLTVKEPYEFYSDKSLLGDVGPEAVIHRTPSIEPMRWVRKLLKRRWEEAMQAPVAQRELTRTSIKPGFLVRIKELLLVPDNEMLWFPFAVPVGLRVIRRVKPDVIYSTAPPYTSHLIALSLSLVSGLPWVADFRDQWVDRPNFPLNRWRQFLDRKLERTALGRTVRVVTVTRPIADAYQKLYPGLNCTVITNGYDESDFSRVKGAVPEKGEFRITHTGIFNRERNPQKFFLAVRQLVDSHDDFKNNVRLKFVGQLDNPGDLENYQEFLRLGLQEYGGPVSYQDHLTSIDEMRRATVLLLLIGEYPMNERVMTGKIFEYVRAGRPILAVVPPDGAAAGVIMETNSGIVVRNDSVDDIARGILELYEMHRDGTLDQRFRSTNFERYERKRLTSRLAEVLTEAAAGSGGR